MSLRERLGLEGTSELGRRKRLYTRFGVLENPFPPASQPMGHPHMLTRADEEIVVRLRAFLDDKTTQVVVVEGTQGVGKTNLLEYYKNELSGIFAEDSRYYIIRYYPDPEAEFRGVIRRIIQDFEIAAIMELGRRLASIQQQASDLRRVLSVVRGHETAQAFRALGRAAKDSDDLRETSECLQEYLLGLRLLKRHTERLGVKFRLDTTESQTQALHDFVYFSRELGCLEAIFLFMDELEKQAGVQSQMVVVRYLSAIRALIDALPHNLFLVLGMTSDARRRYAGWLPALAGRMAKPVTLFPLQNDDEAFKLYEFYLDAKRKAAEKELRPADWRAGDESILSPDRVRSIYRTLLEEGQRAGAEGVTQRAFLDQLHRATEAILSAP